MKLSGVGKSKSIKTLILFVFTIILLISSLSLLFSQIHSLNSRSDADLSLSPQDVWIYVPVGTVIQDQLYTDIVQIEAQDVTFLNCGFQRQVYIHCNATHGLANVTFTNCTFTWQAPIYSYENSTVYFTNNITGTLPPLICINRLPCINVYCIDSEWLSTQNCSIAVSSP